ncbi:MAG: HAD hydrolase family protein [Flavobacteriales bacterium]|nr:HAD hydrolase family protein [Flavobacteriales bacterium]
MELPKIIFTDIDGVWTDGGMYYDESDTELKKFNTSDSVGVLFAQLLDIPVVILTGENSLIVKRRAKKLKIKEVYLGAKNKLELAKNVCTSYGFTLSDAAFIGDDINDLTLLKEVGYAGAPCTSKSYVTRETDYVTKVKGGEGAFRDFVEHLFERSNKLEYVLDLYLKNNGH